MMAYYYDRDGMPMSRDQWAASFEDLNGRRIGSTLVDHRWHVSTVWLGLDHGYWPGMLPLIFETCVFDHHNTFEYELGNQHFVTCDSCVLERYSNEASAVKGHRRWVRRIRKYGASAYQEEGGETPVGEPLT